MKTLAINCICLLFALSCFSQKKKTIQINCDAINSSIIDTTLYRNINGRLMFIANLNNKDVYKVSTPSSAFYYVGKPLMLEIKKTIVADKCKNIIIEKVVVDKNAPKIVRD